MTAGVNLACAVLCPCTAQVVLVADDSLVPYVQDCITCLKRCTKLKSRDAISDIGKVWSMIHLAWTH